MMTFPEKNNYLREPKKEIRGSNGELGPSMAQHFLDRLEYWWECKRTVETCCHSTPYGDRQFLLVSTITKSKIIIIILIIMMKMIDNVLSKK